MSQVLMHHNARRNTVFFFILCFSYYKIKLISIKLMRKLCEFSAFESNMI
jgi:hypothetical protein